MRWAGLEEAPGDGAGGRDEQSRRFRMFCRAYGLDVLGDLRVLVDQAVLRLLALVDLIQSRADAGEPAFHTDLHRPPAELAPMVI